MSNQSTKSEKASLEGGLQSQPVHTPISEELLGQMSLSPTGEFEAGSLQTFTLVYTAGKYGIDDSGSMRVCFRFASDQSRPQFENAEAAGYTTIEASNNAVLQYRYDRKGNVRPWGGTLYIKVVNGFLSEGDTITIRLGDTRKGSPGLRLQTFCEDSFEFHVLVDPIATCVYQPIMKQPVIRIVPGKPQKWIAVVPTQKKAGEKFPLRLKAVDRWGNPTNKFDTTVHLRANGSVNGLPETVTFRPGDFVQTVHNLSVAKPGDVLIRVEDASGNGLCESNPMRVVESAELNHFWADLHGQSEETIGTNSARKYFEFARDFAFLDATGHQGNDFQITNAFWSKLNTLNAQFNERDRFITLPGYEWSGNTHLGGDRNVYFTSEARQIRRSSHALIPDKSDIHTDATTAEELFRAFDEHGEDVICFAHCGGRYADVKLAHNGRFERSMEIHSSWGTFEWLLNDAFEMGHRVGIVANSDDHKGRPGASYPGASLFGAIGGLTCLLMPELSREAVIECMRKRRHYATTGCRLLLDVRAVFPQGGAVYEENPATGQFQKNETNRAMMGDMVQIKEGKARLRIDALGSAPIQRIIIKNGPHIIEEIRPYSPGELGDRICVIWEGAAYRGRFRQVIWDGEATLRENGIVDFRPINFFNPDKQLKCIDETRLQWQALTTGNIGGFELRLREAAAGVLKLNTPLIKCEIPIKEIGYEDRIFDNSGVLPRSIRIFRLPSENPHRSITIEREIDLTGKKDNPIFVKLIQEDGHMAWSSPIYLSRNSPSSPP